VKINETEGRPGSWLDARSLMDQAAREDAAEREERGSYQLTLADHAARAYELFKIGVWHLEQDDPGEAARWLRSAVEQDIVEAEPLLEICLQAVESVPVGRDAHADEHEAAAAERQVALSDAENDVASADSADAGEATPIYDAVADGLGDIVTAQGSIIHVKYSNHLQRVPGERIFGATVPLFPHDLGAPAFAPLKVRLTGNNRPTDGFSFACADQPSPATEWEVLVLAPHIVALARLDDLLPLLEADHRVQRVFAVLEDGGDRPDSGDFVRSRGEILLSAKQAAQTTHGLVLAGSTRGLDDVRGPALLVPHGGGLGQYRSGELVTGLHPEQLMRAGRVRADRIVLTHAHELDLLAEVCPQAVPNAVVAGDIAFDRLVASAPYRLHYRHALGVTDHRKIILVTTTWSSRSGFGIDPDLFSDVAEAARLEGFLSVASLHPQIWSQHGKGQVFGWLSEATDAGLAVLAPRTDWRSAVAAADHVMADYISVGTFAAGFGAPALRISHDPKPLLEGSSTAVLAQRTPLWDDTRPLWNRSLVSSLGDRSHERVLRTWIAYGRADILTV
jgi:hypothetical protein